MTMVKFTLLPRTGLVFLALLHFIGLSAQNKYYISPNGDNSNGLSPASAWNDPANLDELTMSPGDSVFFERGYTYRPSDIIDITSSGSNSQYLYFGSYGKGTKPKIVASEVVIWTPQGENIWKSSAIANPMTISWWANIFIEEGDTVHWGTYLGEVAPETVLLDSITEWCYNDGSLFLYSEVNPNSEVSIEIPQRTRIFRYWTAEYIHFDSLSLHYAVLANLSDENARNDIYQVRGLKITNCHISHVGWKGTSYGYCVESHHSDVYIANNEIHDGGRRAISLTMYSTTNDIVAENIVIERNHFHDGWHTTGVDCIIAENGGHLIDSVIVRNNYFQGDPNARISLTSPNRNDNPPSNHMYFSNQTGADTGRIDRVYIYNNVATYSTGKHFVIGQVDKAYVVNNTFYNHNRTTPDPQDQWSISLARNEGHDINVFNNIIYIDSLSFVSPNGGDILWMFFDDVRSDVNYTNMDYNLFYAGYHGIQVLTMYESGSDYDTYNNTLLDWGNYKFDYSPFEANSPDPTDPNFIFTYNDLLLIDDTSPAYQAGKPFWFVRDDYLGNPRDPDTPSIGAYEYFEPDPSAAEILYFILKEQAKSPEINKDNGTILCEVKQGTDRSNLSPEIIISPGASIQPASGIRQDFSLPVEYVVTSEDGTVEKTWSVTVELSGPSPGQDPSEFKLYPNPAKEIVNIEFLNGQTEPVIVIVYNQSNIIVFSETYIPANNKIQVPIGELSNGTYTLQAIIEEKNSIYANLIILRE